MKILERKKNTFFSRLKNKVLRAVIFFSLGLFFTTQMGMASSLAKYSSTKLFVPQANFALMDSFFALFEQKNALTVSTFRGKLFLSTPSFDPFISTPSQQAPLAKGSTGVLALKMVDANRDNTITELTTRDKTILLVAHIILALLFLGLCYSIYSLISKTKKYDRLLAHSTSTKKKQSERIQKQEQIVEQLTVSAELTEKNISSFLNYTCQRLARGLSAERVVIFQLIDSKKNLNCIASFPKKLMFSDNFKDPVELKMDIPHVRADHTLAKDFLNNHYDLSDFHYWIYNIEFKNKLYGFVIVEKPKKIPNSLPISNLFIRSVLNILVLHFESREKHEIERELFKQYYFDPFTQLPNMKGLVYQLNTTIETQPAGGLLLLEVANLASINNIYGMQKGDELLLLVSERLQRITDTSNFAARIGQNKFTMLSYGWDLEGINIYLLKLFEILSEAFILDGQKISASLNGGAAFFPRNSTDPHKLIDCAVQALQIAGAKKAGTMVLYDNISVETVSKKHLLTIALHKALALNELEVYYQPFMATDSFMLHGAEALMRWNSPQFGLLKPDDYISIAEETGMIVEFGLWILEEACKQAKKWQETYNENFTIAVNVSPQQLLDPDFAKKVLAIIKKHQLNPRTLELEITEMIASKEDSVIDKNVNLLVKENIYFAIDDFGSGYASFNYIKRFASKKIKIDRKFTENIEHSPRDASLVKVIVAMGHALNSKVTAEGISSLEQFTVIKEIGCDYIQGFFIAQPMPADQFEQLISKHVPRQII